MKILLMHKEYPDGSCGFALTKDGAPEGYSADKKQMEFKARQLAISDEMEYEELTLEGDVYRVSYVAQAHGGYWRREAVSFSTNEFMEALASVC